MLKVLICDDDCNTTARVSELLNNTKSTNNIDFEVDVKNNSSFIKDSKAIYDIAIVDIEMPDISGLELSEKLKEQNPDIIVTILTSYSDYLDKAMKISVFRYLSKPVETERFNRNFIEAVVHHRQICKQIVIESKDKVNFVKTKDILYIENLKHGSLIVTKHSKFKTNKIMLLGFGASIAVQFGVSYIGIPALNLLGFAACNFLLCFLLFKAGVLQALFNTMILAVTMLITEMGVFHLSTLLLGIEENLHTENDTVLWSQSVCAKLLYFFAAYLMAKFSTAEHRQELKTSKASLLMILPLASIGLLLGFSQVLINSEVSSNIYVIFIVSTMLLLCSNIIVFWIHESMIKVQNENIEYRLQQQNQKSTPSITKFYRLNMNIQTPLSMILKGISLLLRNLPPTKIFIVLKNI